MGHLINIDYSFFNEDRYDNNSFFLFPVPKDGSFPALYDPLSGGSSGKGTAHPESGIAGSR
jgi:hypothetical protein